MSFFQKLKKEIGIEEELERKEKLEKEIKKKGKKKKRIEEKEKPQEEKTASSIERKKKSPNWLKTEGQLAVDVYQTENEFCIQAPIAGVEAEDIDVALENEMLTIRGERKEPDQEKQKEYFYQECYWGPFSRQIILPEDIDTQRIKATLSKGILTIKIPRVRKIKKKKIVIQARE